MASHSSIQAKKKFGCGGTDLSRGSAGTSLAFQPSILIMRTALFAALVLVATVSSSSAQSSAPPSIVEVAKATVEKLGRTDYVGVMTTFSPRLKAALTEKKLRSAWEGVIKKNGAFQNIGATTQRMNGKLRAVGVDTTYAKGKVEVEVVFNDAGEVAGLLFHRR